MTTVTGKASECMRRIAYSVEKRGIFGTIALAASRPVAVYRSAFRRRLKEPGFDARYGTDTAEPVVLTNVRTLGKHRLLGHHYQAIHSSVVQDALSAIPDLQGYTLVDFGSGKGKALMLALEWPFTKIIGVEFSPELHAIALRNLDIYCGADLAKRGRAESVLMDACDYRLPPVPCACLFFNPFDPPVMLEVLANIRQSYFEAPRPMYIVYADTPREVEPGEPFRLVAAGKTYFVFKAG